MCLVNNIFIIMLLLYYTFELFNIISTRTPEQNQRQTTYIFYYICTFNVPCRLTQNWYKMLLSSAFVFALHKKIQFTNNLTSTHKHRKIILFIIHIIFVAQTHFMRIYFNVSEEDLLTCDKSESSRIFSSKVKPLTLDERSIRSVVVVVKTTPNIGIILNFILISFGCFSFTLLYSYSGTHFLTFINWCV